MRKPEVPYSTIEECARHADIIGVRSVVLCCGLLCCVMHWVWGCGDVDMYGGTQ
jgi:hypothetical protein